MEITRVGIRDAKIHLSRFLKIVKNGGEVILTEHGKPVGKIVPFHSSELPLSERLKMLEDKGQIEPRIGKGKAKVYPPIPVPDDIAQRFLKEDRKNGS